MTVIDAPTIRRTLFDDIKHTRPDGTEFWSARELMPLMGYARWENFEVPLSRAQASARAQEHDIDSHFLRSQEKTSGRPRINFALTRFAAYLVAMNGDPNMPEVAAAQSYFAIRTREAETRPAPRELTFEEKVQEVMGELTARVEDQRRQLEVAKPLAARAITYSAGAQDIGRQEFAREVCKMLREQLDIDAKFTQVYDFLGRKLNLFIVGHRRDNGHATSHGERNGWSLTEKGTTTEGRNYATGKLTRKGQDYAWKRIYDHAEQHQTIALPKKENHAA